MERKTIVFKIQRYAPNQDKEPYFKSYEVPVEQGMTILECLWYIKENLDSTISFRSSCRMGICGSCAMFIQGRPRLACETQTLELKSSTIEIKPLPNYDIIKDLVVDQRNLFRNHKKVKPYIISEKATSNPTKEYIQSVAQLEQYLQFNYCLKCGCCLAACPTMATDTNFLGPQALAQAFRYNTDSRDRAGNARFQIVDTFEGIWRCHMAGACSDACPKGVDPAMAIQLLKRHSIFGSRKEYSDYAGPLPKNRRPDIPDAPAPTVKGARTNGRGNGKGKKGRR
ncbi:MAG: succinate dehydrogenase / fumarate reductase, iron-sulfur subunit [Clostridia bacterium]|nr:succinate dehydrogenase / fumarate reductase, iron-sulfur subunit [Clostridia bacterium]